MRIVEVSPRDGLQNEKTPIPTEQKARLILNLVQAGLVEIEVGSFVAPQWVPQLADIRELWECIHKQEFSSQALFSALVPNEKGHARAIELGVSRVALFTAASDAFTLKNINMTIEQSLLGFESIIQTHRQKYSNSFVRGYVSTIFECPYAGRITPRAVRTVIDKLLEMGVDEVSLGDTTGVGCPVETRALINVLQGIPKEKVAWHFHDTRGTAIANVSTALDAGYSVFDASAGGLGGCPYAKGAGGNLATEDLVYFLERSGVPTGVDLDLLSRATLEILQTLGKLPTAKAQLASLASSE